MWRAGGQALDEGFVRLAARVPFAGDPSRVVALLNESERPWSGTPSPDAPSGLRRFLVDLQLPVGEARRPRAIFRKAALLDLGPAERLADGWVAEIGWRAARGQPLFPVFSGRLFIDREALRIEGLYAPPGGIAGRVADRMLLHLAANGTARWLLAELARDATELEP